MGAKAYRSIIEHVRRAHPDSYIKTSSSDKEGWLEILRHNGISASDMERSVSGGSSPSEHNASPKAVQRQSPPQQLPITSAPLPTQTPAISSGTPPVPVSQVQGVALVSAERDQAMSPGGPREFVHPYMLQHEVDAMALYEQNGHAGPMGFGGHPVVVPVSTEQNSQNLDHESHGRHLSMDGALKPCFGDIMQMQLDPTLSDPLFPSMSDNIAEPQTQLFHAHLSQHNWYPQRQIPQAQAIQMRGCSHHAAEATNRKRGRDDNDGFYSDGHQEPPSKKASARTQPAVLDNTARHNPNDLSVFPGSIPPLTNERFGLSLEKSDGNHFRILIGSTICAMATNAREVHSNDFCEELMRRWPSADELAVAPPEEIMALMEPMVLEFKKQLQLRDALQTLARGYAKLPPTKDVRFGCEGYPRGVIHNVKDSNTFEAEDQDLANEVHARNASWEICHITKHHVVIDAWRIFGRDVLLGRALDWKGNGTAAGFEPEWKRVKPQDPALRTFLAWMWMKEGVYWGPLTDAKQPLPESTRLAVNHGRVHLHTDGRFFFRLFTETMTFEPIDASGTSPSMTTAPYMNGGASSPMGFMSTVPHFVNRASNGFTQNAVPQNTGTQYTGPLMSAASTVGGAEDPCLVGGLVPPNIDGPDACAGLAAFDDSMFDGDNAFVGDSDPYFE